MSRKCAIRKPAAGRWRAWAAAAPILILTLGQAGAQGALPPGLVYLRDLDPSIAQDIRYAGSDNFVGRPLPGYDAAECILRRDAAVAIKQVQADLAASGLALKVYDCYRPMRAARAMAQWANDGQGGVTKRFFPRLPKERLFGLGYIATRSRHSTGTAIDVTLIEASHAQAAAAFDPAAGYGPCTGPAAQRGPDNSVDMGTGYDCLDVLSHTASPAISAEQRRRRSLLATAMARRGFRNYHREWWHFAYAGSAPLSYYDVPIRP